VKTVRASFYLRPAAFSQRLLKTGSALWGSSCRPPSLSVPLVMMLPSTLQKPLWGPSVFPCCPPSKSWSCSVFPLSSVTSWAVPSGRNSDKWP
jgi:hypothetical protein